MAEHQSSGHEPEHKTFDVTHAEGRMNWVFFDFWPIMLWVVVFLLMCGIPLTLSGMMHNPFSSADVVWPGYGLLLFMEFLVALVIFIVAPRLVPPYTLVLVIYGLILAEQGKAWTAGNTPWGSSIGILFLTYVLAGWIAMIQDERGEKKKAL